MLYNIESLFFLLFLFLAILVIAFIVWRYQQDRKLIESVTDLKRGTKSERRLVLKLLKLGFPASDIFHDLYLDKGNGWFSQIDVVLVTSSRVYVFEVKDYSGWLFGNGYQRYWTQVLNYGKEKHRFYNPVFQNKAHVEAIKYRIPQLANVPIQSVIVFYGNCEFKNVSQIPEDVSVIYSSSVAHIVNNVSNKNDEYYIDIEGVKSIFRESVKNGANPEVRYKHIKNIQDNVLGR